MTRPKLRLVKPDDPLTWDWPLVWDYRVEAWTNINRPGGSPFWDRARWRGILADRLKQDYEQEQLGLARAGLFAELRDVGEVKRGSVEQSMHEQLERSGDPILELMKELGLPLTQESWLEFNYPEGVPDPPPGEIWASIPTEIREDE